MEILIARHLHEIGKHYNTRGLFVRRPSPFSSRVLGKQPVLLLIYDNRYFIISIPFPLFILYLISIMWKDFLVRSPNNKGNKELNFQSLFLSSMALSNAWVNLESHYSVMFGKIKSFIR